ncbi:MAG TPA: hypothetical protein VHX60_04480 [Acidobacteriaceae bacterium]|jgi:hypothetical protein|nr:hypothetical protein [Acidobacteriaceae bacterium]
MNPRSRAAVLIGSAVALTVPYVVFVVYFSFKLPKNHWPVWFTDVLLVWFLANFVAVSLIARRMAKKTPPPTAKSQEQFPKSTPRLWILRAVCSYLVIVWIVLFVNGAKGTIRGEYPLDRAIPAGAVLLFFISLFGFIVYRSFRPGASTVTTPKST